MRVGGVLCCVMLLTKSLYRVPETCVGRCLFVFDSHGVAFSVTRCHRLNI